MGKQCTTKSTWWSRKKLIFFAVIIISIFLMSIFFSYVVNPIIINTIELKSKSMTTQAINSAIADVLDGTITYNDLVNIVTNEIGDVELIQANTLKVNMLSKDIARSTETKLDTFGQSGIKIPLGTFTGMTFLVGKGPSLTLSTMPIGAVTCAFESMFESAGINQTAHRIYLNVTADVGVVLPFTTRKLRTSQAVMVSENIIIGKIPDVYLETSVLDRQLNFVPLPK